MIGQIPRDLQASEEQMKIAILGGAGAMGSLFGGKLAQAGADVTLVDVYAPAVEAINRKGLEFTDKAGATELIPVRATTTPAEVGHVNLIVVFVKCYHTESAVRSALVMVGENTVLLTIQNGWGNVPVIEGIVGQNKLLAGVTYNSGTLVAPGHVHFTNVGKTTIGELNGNVSERAEKVANIFRRAGFEIQVTDEVLKAIWSKLVYNSTNLAPMSLLGFKVGEFAKHDGTRNLSAALLREAVQVANAQGIALDYEERWETICDGLDKAAASGSQGKASMLQDVENRRRTEIEVINGAIVDAGQRLGIPTPYNQAMVWLIKSLQETF
jgi:2-dehydropantoate 2-reductase